MRRIKLLLLGFLIPFLSGFIYYSWAEAFEPPARYGEWHMGPGMMSSWDIGGFGMFLIMAFWALGIVGLIFLIKWMFQAISGAKGRKVDGSFGAIEILKQRYARGEIDQAEFETKKRAWQINSMGT